MRIALLSNEYPPNVYGGAGVHVEYLSRELALLEGGSNHVDLLCFGAQDIESGSLRVRGVTSDCTLPFADARHVKLFDTLARNIAMAGSLQSADVVHCHTWYTHFAGCLIKRLMHAPLVLTAHSLEPHRPWKREQLGTAYDASAWIERTAYENADGVIAVSRSMKRDVETLYGVAGDRVRVIHNGIDLREYRPSPDPVVLARHGIDPDRPYILFVGRITRQKGILHLVNALRHIQSGVQIVLCAGAPDTPDIAVRMKAAVDNARGLAPNSIIWIEEMLPRSEIITLYTHAAIFVCPSVYEPFGIINLEAMACETPVVASAIGGIPEVVVDGETGLLVGFEPAGQHDFEPRLPEEFSRGLAEAINELLDSPERLRTMGQAARRRVEEKFSWTVVAEQTLAFYRDLTGRA